MGQTGRRATAPFYAVMTVPTQCPHASHSIGICSAPLSVPGSRTELGLGGRGHGHTGGRVTRPGSLGCGLVHPPAPGWGWLRALDSGDTRLTSPLWLELRAPPPVSPCPHPLEGPAPTDAPPGAGALSCAAPTPAAERAAAPSPHADAEAQRVTRLISNHAPLGQARLCTSLYPSPPKTKVLVHLSWTPPRLPPRRSHCEQHGRPASL